MRSHALLLVLAWPLVAIAGGPGYAALPGGRFHSALKYEDRKAGVRIPPFQLMRQPVTNAEFLAFVRARPQWRRDAAPATLAGPGYLSHWTGPLTLASAAQALQPATHVSWFAAKAYCSAQGARLPSWNEWEYAAAADETRRDARSDPAWAARILDWQTRPSDGPLPRAGLQVANAYGIRDLHGLVWEWTDDFSSLLVSDDNRSAADGGKAKFCGAGALAVKDPKDYAVLMQVEMLSSLQAQDNTGHLGFRCARDIR